MKKIIAVANEKGGCGRATITFLLATELLKKDFAVLTINLGEHENLFWETIQNSGKARHYNVNQFTEHFPNEQTLVTRRTNSRQKLEKILQSEKRNFDYILINFAREINPEELALTDLVIVPFICSAIDSWALPKSIAKIREAQRTNPYLEFALLYNLYTNNRDSKHFASKVKQELKVPVFNSKIGKRNYFNELIAGRESLEVDWQAMNEISELRTEVVAKLSAQHIFAPKSKEKHVKLAITIPQDDANFLEDLRSRITDPHHSFYPTRSDLLRAAVEYLKRTRKKDITDLVKNFKELK